LPNSGHFLACSDGEPTSLEFAVTKKWLRPGKRCAALSLEARRLVRAWKPVFKVLEHFQLVTNAWPYFIVTKL